MGRLTTRQCLINLIAAIETEPRSGLVAADSRLVAKWQREILKPALDDAREALKQDRQEKTYGGSFFR